MDSVASNSEVQIALKESKYANLYYQIVKDEKPIEEEIKYVLTDSGGNVICNGETEDSIIYIEHVPWGNYTIILQGKDDYMFKIDVTKEYIKTQHIMKILKIEENNAVKTGDDSMKRVALYLGLEFLAISILVFMSKKGDKT